MGEEGKNQFVYVWRTSLPKQIVQRNLPVKHISELRRPINTLDFLRETQRYIRKIRHPEKPQEVPKKRVGTVMLPRLRSELLSRNETVETPNSGSQSPQNRLIVKARSCERVGDDMEMEVKPYAITRYMPVQKTAVKVQSATSGEKTSGKVFVNQEIERFMKRFEKRMERQNKAIAKKRTGAQ